MRFLSISVIVLVLLAIQLVAAVDFDMTYNVVNDTIFPDEEATYEITIHNNQRFADTFSIYTIDPSWNIKINPITIDVGAESSEEFTMSVKPRVGLKTGPYLIPVRVASEVTNQDIEENFYLYLKSFTRDKREYLPSVSLLVKVPTEVDPRTKVPIEITMLNRNLLDIEELLVEVRSDIFQDTYTTSLGPLEDKTQEILFAIDPLVGAGEYRFTITLIRDNRTVSELSKFITIIDYSRITDSLVEEKELFKTTKTVTVKNVGNELKDKTITHPYGFLENIFTTTTPNSKIDIVDGEKMYTWTVLLEPQEETTLVIVHNYRSLVTIIVILVLLVIGYFIFRSPIVSYKQAKRTGSHSGVSHMKVRLFIKNRTKRPVYNVKVIERIPGLAEVASQEATLGTLKPNKILRHDKSGTIVRWDIEKFEPYEERIITYTIKSHLKIVGSIQLPAAKIKFDTGLGKERVSYSNAIVVEEVPGSNKDDETE